MTEPTPLDHLLASMYDTTRRTLLCAESDLAALTTAAEPYSWLTVEASPHVRPGTMLVITMPTWEDIPVPVSLPTGPLDRPSNFLPPWPRR